MQLEQVGAVEALGEFDDQAFGSADVAQEERVLEVDDLPERLPAGLSEAVDDATYVVHLEGDMPGSARASWDDPLAIRVGPLGAQRRSGGRLAENRRSVGGLPAW